MASSASTPKAATGFKRRVFFVTDLTRDELTKQFGDAGSEFEANFEFSEKNDEDAEFIIFDLNHLPEEWVLYLGKDRRVDRGVPIDAGNRVPLFFLRLGSESAAGQVSEEVKVRLSAMQEGMKVVGIEFKPANMQQIIKQLDWFQRMMPFYRKEPPSGDTGSDVIPYVVLAMKNK